MYAGARAKHEKRSCIDARGFAVRMRTPADGRMRTLGTSVLLLLSPQRACVLSLLACVVLRDLGLFCVVLSPVVCLMLGPLL